MSFSLDPEPNPEEGMRSARPRAVAGTRAVKFHHVDAPRIESKAVADKSSSRQGRRIPVRIAQLNSAAWPGRHGLHADRVDARDFPDLDVVNPVVIEVDEHLFAAANRFVRRRVHDLRGGRRRERERGYSSRAGGKGIRSKIAMQGLGKLDGLSGWRGGSAHAGMAS